MNGPKSVTVPAATSQQRLGSQEQQPIATRLVTANDTLITNQARI